MATQYRIIDKGGDTFYVETSHFFLFFTLWRRLRDCHAASHQGYSYTSGSYVRYRTAADAAETIEYLRAAEAGYKWPERTLHHQLQ